MTQKTIDAKIVKRDFSIQKTFTLKLNLEKAQQMYLSLSLLKEQLVDTLEINFVNYKFFLKSNSRGSSTCNSLNERDSILKLSLSSNLLEYAMIFLLKYYRDGVGESEHIDLDFEYEENMEVTLTIQIDNYFEHSTDTLNELMGL